VNSATAIPRWSVEKDSDGFVIFTPSGGDEEIEIGDDGIGDGVDLSRSVAIGVDVLRTPTGDVSSGGLATVDVLVTTTTSAGTDRIVAHEFKPSLTMPTKAAVRNIPATIVAGLKCSLPASHRQSFRSEIIVWVMACLIWFRTVGIFPHYPR